jgi:hypothetical protein
MTALQAAMGRQCLAAETERQGKAALEKENTALRAAVEQQRFAAAEATQAQAQEAQYTHP